ncbi:NFX1-type zinc finger-containing protein 1 [Fulvia fulva]|uniref:NFX1-type zinc finger-containing protein 1 n=1 Tax=Passalora fulva TaxID=5499 RepID=A0A9Q8UVF3_PASFU|nr:NFX1-type zinc finger-containing protein 1 [Fulvia fulva]KAK4611584.1 NFX1-type zinc finger-containing protein 1 [Fulvia fulva]UJO23934.1 NFX1-type zinc finger-containing protein 1 [Fulvia fulva]WPV21560.1 NFX1-type zinc finger-containing protein 1 [Fulvia fulva]WPV36202.1 NFX1-type zinc finger-containing protein 1 [Fulvia fulva]
MDIGIPSSSMVRLGSKSTARTQPLSIGQQAPPGFRSRENWDTINRLNEELTNHANTLDQSVITFRSTSGSDSQLLEYLEFSEEDYDFFEAFVVPKADDGFRYVREDGREINSLYLLRRWYQGKDPGIFSQNVSPWHIDIWNMDGASRRSRVQEWRLAMLSEAADNIVAHAHVFDSSQQTLQEALGRQKTEVIQQKRIVACTTTAASMYSKHLQSASPGIVLVEEAGEILESHVLTAMTSGTKQLVLIGDHRQLRPKVNNYSLTVEKGDGFDLNRSLFERLVLAGLPHTTLTQQHRMCPEISSLVRWLAYPDLLDAPSKTQREPLRGLQKRVVFVKHEKLELHSHVADRRDQGASTSKQNEHEVAMVKKVVKYMAQQGYGTACQVVLTPYLGQLGLLRRELAKDNDPVLNDMDSFDLVRAGLLSPASASQKKQPLKLSTVDNYQGEEADIVIVSLTRSNPNGDIGFMISPERLNVLLSRARKALIIIGNPATFLASKKGGELWSSFFALLAETNSILDGLPVRCAQHPDREMMLCSPEEFDQLCPDGGCAAPCGVTLSCGQHQCQQKCHRRTDHSRMQCKHRVQDKCPQGHKLTWTCSQGHPVSCRTCDAEAAALLAQQQRNAELDKELQARQAAYASELAKIQAELDHVRLAAKDKREQDEQSNELTQRRKDLENAKALAARQVAAAETSKKQKSTQAGAGAKQPKVSSTIPESSSNEGDRDFKSEATLDWEHQKTIEGAKNEAMDQLMAMIGLEAVKEQFLEIKSKVDLLVRQDLSITKERFVAALLGNPGSGKTTVARLYAKFLCSVGALPGDNFVETTGAKLASEGVQGCKKLLEDLLNQGGGAFFIDEAYQLTSGSNFGGAAVLDYLLPEVENLTGKVVFILAGYNKQMEKFFQHNPGLPSRFARRMQFDDYEDDELLAIMNYNLTKRYEGRMKLEDGHNGLYARIVARRIGRGRGKEGFGNAREVENVVSMIASRQAKRLRRERKARGKRESPDDMLFTKTDMIGPEPKNVLAGNKSWLKLQKLIGLDSVKESVRALLASIQNNYQRELAEEPLVEYSLNKVFIGNPGSGKTSVAKIYGQMLADIGMLSSGEVVIKKPADFVGSVQGASEANTKGILDAAVGKVLVIDEAYGLYGGGQGSNSDPYRTAVIDTIVAEIQSVPGDDRCVLLLGYKDQMEEMFQHVNPGLARRFPIASGFVFEDFKDDDMAAILDMKLKDQGFGVTERARQVALSILQRARNCPHFGNAGEVDIILNDAKMRQQKRIAGDDTAATGMFEASDFDPDFDRGDRATTNVAALFKDTVGCETIVAQLQGYQTVAANMKELEMDPREQIPFAFLFRGPPGIGKTTTASKMGKVFYDMGFLSKAEVVQCSASDLVGEYVGQTGPKTRKLLEKALGKVLFIDEAYRLSGGMFAQEALDELVDGLTNERFFRKLVVILAGYDADINRLMSMNPGLTSRFPETITFKPLRPEVCLDLLIKTLAKKKGLDISPIENLPTHVRDVVLEKFSNLATQANFANARDIQTLSKTIFGTLVKDFKKKAGGMTVTQDLLLKALNDMIVERANRAADATTAGASNNLSSTMPQLPRSLTKEPQPQRKIVTRSMSTAMSDMELADQGRAPDSANPSPTEANDQPPASSITVQRDPGVSDAIWTQLQIDRMKAEQEEREFERLKDEERKLRAWLKACADAKRQKELEEIERKRKEAEEKRRKEALAQKKLEQMGCCPVGYQWIKQQGGWRCAGGSHWMDDGAVDRMVG